MNRGETIENVIKAVILRNEPIPFERFMDMALYYPSFGYYTSPGREIGRAGDFYTASHLHPLFGAVIARQLEECWDILGKPGTFTVAEQGAGKGYLALDILDYLKGRALYDALSYTLVEINPSQVSSQERLLKDHRKKVQWKNDLKEVPPFTGCYLSNELPDAFPVHLVQMEDRLREVYVGLQDDRFIEILAEPSTPKLSEYLSEFDITLAKGYRTEINLRIKDWLAGVSEKISEGFIITIDYGYTAQEYYSGERDRGTLLCYFRHQVNENPYEHIGEQDITSHVNFSSLKQWGEKLGLKTLGYCSQGTYLVSMGLDEVVREKYRLDEREPDQEYQFEAAKLKGLILPGAMGESHKVMLQYKGDHEVKPRGFMIRNRLRAL